MKLRRFLNQCVIIMLYINLTKTFHFLNNRFNKPKTLFSISKASLSKQVYGDLLQGLVIERYGDKLLIEYNENHLITCNQKTSLSNSNIVVGDYVNFDINAQTNVGIVHAVQQRLNLLERPAAGSNLRKKITMKTIASNIDQMIIVTAAKPKVPLITIDQLIVAAIANYIQHIHIIINKVDEEYQDFERDIDIYRQIGYSVIKVSTIANIGIPDVENLLMNKTSIFVGQSGVGKV